MTLTALDLYAGTGWGVACQKLGIREFGRLATSKPSDPLERVLAALPPISRPFPT